MTSLKSDTLTNSISRVTSKDGSFPSPAQLSMASTRSGWGWGSVLLLLGLVLMFAGKAEAFGAGNVPSISVLEGVTFRHGDIEDALKTIAFLHSKKWTTMLVQRTYFGNWYATPRAALPPTSIEL